MSVHKANEGIEAMRDELLHLETIGRLPRVDYKTGNPDFTAVMSGLSATTRMDAEFARLFSPPSPACNQPITSSAGGGSSNSEVSPCTTDLPQT